MQNNQKGSSNVVLVVVLTILVLLIAYIVVYKREPKISNEDVLVENTEQTVVPTDSATTNNWKTYTNTEYGFEFQYPLSWYAHNKNGRIILLKSKVYPEIASETYALGDQIIVRKETLLGAWNKKMSVDEFLNIVSTEFSEYEGKVTLVKKEKINGFDMLRVEHTQKGSQSTVAYYVSAGGNVYTIYLFPYRKETSSDNQNNEDFLEVVQSFHITDQSAGLSGSADISKWKTYKKAGYGFEFKYPGDLVFKETKGTDGEGVDYFDVNVDTQANMYFTCEACEGPGTFFRVSAYVPKSAPIISCFPPYGKMSKVVVAGITVDKCVSEGMMGPSLNIYLTKDGVNYYFITADNYSGERVPLIDKIVSTLKLTQ